MDGYGSIGVWNPSTNALTVYNNFSHIQGFTLTGDRSLIVFLTAGLCTLDPATGKSACADLTNFGVHYSVAATPDGKSILVPFYSPGQVAVFDAKSLTRISSFAVNADTSAAASMIVSPDSKTLYIVGGGFVYAYDIASGAQTGWLPNLAVPPISSGGAAGPVDGPNLQAFDNTGLLAGPLEEGVGFLDTSALKTGPMGTQFLNDYLVPATGPAAGGTATQFENVSATAMIGAAYFGGNPATDVSQANAEFYATTPSGPPGPVDVYAPMKDGGTLIVPEGFSYGPAILQVTPDMATAEGGGTGIIYGYGFGSTASNAPIPSDLQITVGGKTATITGFAPNAYGIASPPVQPAGSGLHHPAGHGTFERGCDARDRQRNHEGNRGTKLPDSDSTIRASRGRPGAGNPRSPPGPLLLHEHLRSRGFFAVQGTVADADSGSCPAGRNDASPVGNRALRRRQQTGDLR